MLQMAANAAVPPARPSRTAETSTSTLWAPGAPVLPEQPPCLLQTSRTAAPDSHQQQQPTQLQDTLQGTQGSGTADWPEAQHAAESVASGLTAEADAEDAHAAAADSRDQSSVQSQAEDLASSGMSHSMQLPPQQGSHHDAHQPWATSWSQPALPALTVPTAGSNRPVKQQQHRRSTASDAPASRALQQQAMRNSSGLQAAARSLSWSQSAAADQPLAGHATSGVRRPIDNGVQCRVHLLTALARVTFLLAVKSICGIEDVLGQVFVTCIVC